MERYIVKKAFRIAEEMHQTKRVPPGTELEEVEPSNLKKITYKNPRRFRVTELPGDIAHVYDSVVLIEKGYEFTICAGATEWMCEFLTISSTPRS